ncbi:aromatic acid exporter family protein [Paenibacillus rigui]|uniref:Putative aromatic acid exporter C-terminal domain-containing protein n=1 Tax=Paenibacillus rigui TaxID=554312 RepID=A0A229USG5_9BACL|nr:aromatic acid exporter family protein [Paenibacillus rigui]OXM86577.1 hypothetical protein CF651_08980 [Paenibacillus rigui]
MKIGFRTIKTAVGVCISIFLAETLQLTNFAAAGILTLLCIQKSRKQSFHAVLSRFIACLLSIGVSSVLFSLIGYTPLSFLVLLLLFIPLCVRLRIHEGIASSSVIVMHVYMHRKMDLAFFLNELQVIVIGLGVALLINWYMPSIDKELTRYQEEANRLLCTILHEMAAYLREGYTLWDGKELLLLTEVLKKAKPLVMMDMENQWLSKGSSYYHKLEIKQQQLDIMERMLPYVSRISVKMEQGIRIGDFMQALSSHLSDGTESKQQMVDNLRTIREYHKLLPLPETRHEFENRASLYAVANELEIFINTLNKG